MMIPLTFITSSYYYHWPSSPPTFQRVYSRAQAMCQPRTQDPTWKAGFLYHDDDEDDRLTMIIYDHDHDDEDDDNDNIWSPPEQIPLCRPSWHGGSKDGSGVSSHEVQSLPGVPGNDHDDYDHDSYDTDIMIMIILTTMRRTWTWSASWAFPASAAKAARRDWVHRPCWALGTLCYDFDLCEDGLRVFEVDEAK